MGLQGCLCVVEVFHLPLQFVVLLIQIVLFLLETVLSVLDLCVLLIDKLFVLALELEELLLSLKDLLLLYVFGFQFGFLQDAVLASFHNHSVNHYENCNSECS